MKALILNIGSELKKLLMKKYLVLTVLGAIICILRIGGNVLVSKDYGRRGCYKKQSDNGNGRICF